MAKQIYMDNGATTRTDDAVLKAMLPYFSKEYGNASSIHSFGQAARDAIEHAREIIAKELNADKKEIIFTSGGTESDNLAIRGIAYANKEKGKHIITSKIEHHAVLNTCEVLKKEGYEITYLDVDKDGIVKLNELEKAIRNDTILISIMHANNEIGTIQPIDKIGEIAKKHSIYFHSDAVQSFTKKTIDVKKTNIDLVCVSAHKIHGPKGVGAIFIKKGTKIAKLVEGGHHEFNKRAGTENVPGIVGFAKAVIVAKKENHKKIAQLRDYLIKEITKKIPNTKLNGSKESRLAGNASISFRYVEGEAILLHLNMNGIAVSTGSACTSDRLEPSHVLMALGVPYDYAHGTIRFTLSKYNKKSEIDYTVQKLAKIIKTLRKMSPLADSKRNYDEIMHSDHHDIDFD